MYVDLAWSVVDFVHMYVLHCVDIEYVQPVSYSMLCLESAYICSVLLTVAFSTTRTDAVLNSSYFEMRLNNKNNSTSEGRVEVRYGGLWGTVCDDYWDYQDAQVVCRQLGFQYAVAALSSTVFGPGEGPIWMDNVECNGTELHIGECEHADLDMINCGHSEDAGVICSG